MAILFTWLVTVAGAMIFAVVEELIPESQSGNKTYSSMIGAMPGFATMMFMDVALGWTMVTSKPEKRIVSYMKFYQRKLPIP